MTAVTEIARGAACARLAAHLGGRLTALRLAPPGGAPVELLRPFPEDATSLLHWPKGGLYPLVPYWGRIRDSRVATPAGVVTLLPHPDAAPHTLHGPAHRQPWRTLRQDEAMATLGYEHAGDAEWPWRYRTALQVALPTPDRCTLELTLENTDAAAMPAGLGLHPYFRATADTRLVLSAEAEWPMDDVQLSLPAPGLPLAWDGPVAGPVTRQVGGWGGRARLGEPGVDITLHASDALGHLVLHRPAVSDYLCLEPVTHIADAFNLAAAGAAGTGARWLASGETLTVGLTLGVAAPRG